MMFRRGWYRGNLPEAFTPAVLLSDGSWYPTDLGTAFLPVGIVRPLAKRRRPRAPGQPRPADRTAIGRAARWLNTALERRNRIRVEFRKRELVEADLIEFLSRAHPADLGLPPAAILLPAEKVEPHIRDNLSAIEDPVRALTLLCRTSGRLFLAHRSPHLKDLTSVHWPLVAFGFRRA